MIPGDLQFRAVDYVRVEVGWGEQRQVFEMRSRVGDRVRIRQVLNVGGEFGSCELVAAAMSPFALPQVELGGQNSLTLEFTGGVAVIGAAERVVPGEEGKR